MADQTQVIDANRVFCSRRHRDVDIEACLACRRFRGFKKDGDVRVIVCRTDPKYPPEFEAEAVY